MIIVSDTSPITTSLQSIISIFFINYTELTEALSNELDIGEAEAIALAVEIQADQVLIDERRGRLVAKRLNLRYTGILGILVEAKSQDLITEVKPQPLLDALVNDAGFWIAEPLRNSVLQLVNEIEVV